MKWHSSNHLFFVLLGLWLTLASATKESVITLDGYGYDKIVVGISPDAKRDQADIIIRNLKNLITDASAVLFRATERFYFKSVKILIPQTWTGIAANEALWETYDTSDIRVGPGNWENKDKPFTVHATGCGQMGEYINLTPDYLLKLNDPSMHRMYGPPDKVLVQEWAKYRYGVFEENGNAWDYTRRPNFYKSPESGKMLPNLCLSEEPVFTTWDPITNSSCKINPLTGVYDSNCVYNLATDFQSDHSLMSYHSHALNSLVKFCDDEHHQSAAPTKHNMVCASQSVWSVLRKHPDFNRAVGEPPSVIPEPTFETVQSAGMRYVMVMDVSGSMNQYNRLNRMTEAASNWIKYEMSNGSYLSLVKFSNDASKLTPLVNLENNRDYLMNKLPDRTEGSTCIGCGLNLAVDILTEGRDGGGVIILITDGGENVRPYINDAYDALIRSNARVVSIAFGIAAEDKIESLAAVTGGKSYFIHDDISNTGNNQELNDALEGSLTYEPEVPSNSFEVELFSEVYTSSREISETIYVDNTVGKNFKLRIIYSPSTSRSVTAFSLKSPDNVYYNTLKDRDGYSILELDQAKAGTWILRITFAFDSRETAKVIATAQANDGTAPIKTECFFQDPQINSNGVLSSGVLLIAQVKQGQYPVIGIRQVTGVITPSNGASESVYLRDNGSSGDEEADDGTYSRLIQVLNAGRHTLVCHVEDDGSSFIKDGFVDRGTGTRTATNATKPGAFARKSSGGSFKVTQEMVTAMRKLPPGRITDFQLTDSNTTTFQFSVLFTAPGDVGYTGTVSSYEMSYSASFEDFVPASSSSNAARSSGLTSVTDDMIVGGSLIPAPSGQMQAVTVQIKRDANTQSGVTTFYVAVRGVKSGLQAIRGDWSNIVTVNFVGDDDDVTTERPSATTPRTQPTTAKPVATTPSTTTKQPTKSSPTSLPAVTTARPVSTEDHTQSASESTVGVDETTSFRPGRTTTSRTPAPTTKGVGVDNGSSGADASHRRGAHFISIVVGIYFIRAILLGPSLAI